MELKPEESYLVEAFYEALKIRFKKSMDYNSGGVNFADYFPFGRVSAAQMLYSKSLRLVSLASRDAVNEPVIDTYIDLMVYAAMSYAVEKMRRESDT